MPDSFATADRLAVDGQEYRIFRLDRLEGAARLPFALKLLLENLLRHEDGDVVKADDINAMLGWQPQREPDHEIAFHPARVLMQDFTGVPAIVDLAAMRDAVQALGGDPARVNPLLPTELVIDHSVQVDRFGSLDAADLNTRLEYQRNAERYRFLKWGQQAFRDFQVVPPGKGIVHQVNLEFLARVVFSRQLDGDRLAFPDTLVGTDSHTTMINGLGVLGWGVGGIEAEAAMLGQPLSMLIPNVVGFQLSGELPEGATATDLVLVVVEQLRRHGVVGKFVEFYGDGLDHLPLADRATIANMAPEYGATCGLFPIDRETLRYLQFSGRSAHQLRLVEAYAKLQGMWRESGAAVADYSEVLALDLGEVVPSLAGPRRPQDRVPLSESSEAFSNELARLQQQRGLAAGATASVMIDGETYPLHDGAVVIAAITSCTNTSNPSVMLAAGLVARKAVALGLRSKPWVKTSLAPGSRVVSAYLQQAGLLDELAALGFQVVGYGCTTCIGNSGPLPDPVLAALREQPLVVVSVLSGNRNFEGRVHAEVRMNYLASPPLVVAYAIAGRMDVDLVNEALGEDAAGQPVYLRDIWPSQSEVIQTMAASVSAEQFSSVYADIFEGDANWERLAAGEGTRFAWTDSSYIANPPYFEQLAAQPVVPEDIHGARVLALLGDSVTTDHISPAGSIASDSPAGQYLQAIGVEPAAFNSYGSRRGNHEVMMRGTFANPRLRNLLVPGTEGGITLHLPSATQMPIYDAAMRYAADGVPAILIAGKEYGSGSSRDWAAKGPRLLGVRAVIAESYERIHRSNLIGMGILPLQFPGGETAAGLGLDGHEVYAIEGLQQGEAEQVNVVARLADGRRIEFTARVRIDTPQERRYYRHGGILPFMARRLATV